MKWNIFGGLFGGASAVQDLEVERVATEKETITLAEVVGRYADALPPTSIEPSTMMAEAAARRRQPNWQVALITCRNESDIRVDREALEKELKCLIERRDQALKKLLEVEVLAKEACHREFETGRVSVMGRMENLKKEANLIGAERVRFAKETVAWELDCLYPRIHMEFLSRRQWSKEYKCRLPLFAVYRLDQPNGYLEVRVDRYHGSVETSMSVAALSPYFADTMEFIERQAQEFLRKTGNWGVDMRLIASLPGVIPDSIKTHIASRKERFDEVFLVAEAPVWELQMAKVWPRRDPLVIGRKGDNYWLMDAFDTTPAEDYARKEFTT